MPNPMHKTQREAQTGVGSIVRLNETRPTEEAYGDILFAHQHFNEWIFEGKLTKPMVTFQRKPGMLGAFYANRYKSVNGDLAHEIILNPHYLAQRSDRDSLSTLVHEMVHQWRAECTPDAEKKKAPTGGYHDALWADCMERIGLMPSDTGEVGGKRTGPRVTHYIIEHGLFDAATQVLLDRGYVIRWSDRITKKEAQTKSIPVKAVADQQLGTPAPTKPRSRDRIKFTCSQCGLNAWAKPSAALKCAPCDLHLVAQTMEVERS